ncbi:MAG: sulfite exporter TauE/SafE family protein [Desulfobacterales bacterium]|nr:sulfite exporter TauE/SafE family protein [Desulfobacterales bacterium]
MNGLEYALSGMVILLASFVQGLTGFGFSLLAVPLLTIVIGVKNAVTLGVICGICVTFYNFWTLRRHFTFSSIRELILGSLVGIPVGSYFLRETHSDVVRDLLGLVIIAFVLFSLLNVPRVRVFNRLWGYFFGLAAGLCGGAVSISGPPILIYSYIKDWNKEEFKGTIAAYFFVTGLLIFASHLLTGSTNSTTLLKFMALSPFLVIGAFTGHYFFNSIDGTMFRQIILGILGVLGISMLLL